MAIPERSMDPDPEVEQRLLERSSDGYRGVRVVDPTDRPIPFPRRPPTVRFADALPEVWHEETHRVRAFALLELLEDALVRNRRRRAARLRSAFLNAVQVDRLARARELARVEGLRLDPNGHGPVLHRPSVYLRDRLPWGITPLDGYHEPPLPERARETRATWEAHPGVFDAFYLADEPCGSGPIPCHALVGVISADGMTGQWFVLDRWGS